MKILSVISLLFVTMAASKGQTPANVYITLDNSRQMNIGRYSFFNKEVHYSLYKTDDTHYVLQYTATRPGLIFLNNKPIYVTPGDSIALTYKMFFQTRDVMSDTLMAAGKNSANYMFANLIATRALDNYFPDFKEARYKNNVVLFYNQLCKDEETYNTYFDKLLNARGCNPVLIAYLKRAKRNQLLFNLIYFENEMDETHNPGLAAFSKLVDNTMAGTKFLPGDADLSFIQENLFRKYLTRLVNIKFYHLNTKKDYAGLLGYIDGYPDTYVREYFIYNLLKDYKNKLNLVDNETLTNRVQTFSNQDIKSEINDPKL
ncbi:hypothetical protein [Mucilaginibacter gilvus]|uniref:DUF4369 domain-containing protein n=1 Tax=Mucilaginibacter gilvus TaxID=2305909 RepID=A0A444MS51_9SPHI|nr:hypothetical protein [Mucilaginibacter gilvus]RWY55460.1 hypothetical protein EPL05_03545 [Mucilaginibacter gilvus]